MNKGKLYIVATPIGNLEDITYRAVKTLSNVTFILAEDTRESIKLLKRYDIKTHLVSYRDQNHERMIEKVYEKLNIGLDLALISDCGTPLISDPGFKLVRDLREKGYVIESIPGPSALIAALSISGLPTDKFTFLGFLPKSDVKREKVIKGTIGNGGTIIIYESPKRILDLLKLLTEIEPLGYVVLCKDLTKLREEVISGVPSELYKVLENKDYKENPHGEFVVLISVSK
jgi:16S rRNA (cytidine1402-2'-O)-methyltransferase